MNQMRCYHHCNSDNHPAVAVCSSCGRGLCKECADRLSSPKTGKLLCSDCLNKELEADRQRCLKQKAKSKRELITILVGLGIGIIIEIVLGILNANMQSDFVFVLFVLSFVLFLPTLLASFGTIVSTVGDVFENGFLRVIFFIILAIGSPIMFIVRVVRRVKSTKYWKRLAVVIEEEQQANDKYKHAAENINERRASIEEIERTLRTEYAAMVTSMAISHEEAEMRIKQESQKRLEEAQKKYDLEQAENRKIIQEQSAKISAFGAERDTLNAQIAASERKARKAKKSSGRENAEAA